MLYDVALRASNLSKCYQIYNKPQDRLKQSLWRGRRQFYSEFWALKDISFEVKKGETIGIIGRNGSGKSTLLQIICGTITPTTGSIEAHGKVAALLELGAGFNPEFTGKENVYMNALILGLTQEEIDARYEDIVAFADIGDFIDQPVKTYSSGMSMRLAFAVSAHVDADILIIDEALAVGDAFFTQKCMRFLRRFRENGTILFVSHDTGAVINLCHHAIWLEYGRLKAQGSAKEIAESYLASLCESQDEDRQVKKVSAVKSTVHGGKTAQRLRHINNGSYQNNIELFSFDPKGSGFGKGGAHIVDVRLLSENDEPMAWVAGGETVILSVRAKAEQPICGAIIGFYIKDRLGQYLFGDNTYLSTIEKPVAMNAGEELEARFTFQLPLLPVGDYSVCAAIAEGTVQEHVQHHWLHDALCFKTHTSSVRYGLVGIPMLDIKLEHLKLV